MLRMIQYVQRRMRRSADCVECGLPHYNRNRNHSFTAFCSELCFDLWAIEQAR